MALSIKQVQNIGFRIFELRKQMVYSSLSGNYKNFKKARIEYASEIVQNFDIAKQVNFPEVKVPVFSRLGFNIIKTSFLDFFRIKTHDEKQMMKLFKRAKYDEKISKLLPASSKIYA